MEKKALGRGLEALLPVTEDRKPIEHQHVQFIEVDHILPNRYQPRQDFAEAELQKLAESIQRTGVLQPVVVRRKGDGLYELIAGERRWRAAKLAGVPRIPAMVRNCGDSQAVVFALIENLQRQDLNPMETARAYQRIATEFGMTQDEIAEQVGRDRSSVANLARLVNLPHEIQQLIESGAISTGHAKVILGLARAEDQLRLARRVAGEHLSVRQTERLAESEFRGQRGAKRPASSPAASPYAALESRLQRRFGTKVNIQKQGNRGRVVIHYFSQPELERIVDALLA